MKSNKIKTSGTLFYTFTFNIEMAAIKKAMDEITEIITTSIAVKPVICEYIPALVISTI